MIKTQRVVERGNLNALRYSNEMLTPVCIPHLQNNGDQRTNGPVNAHLISWLLKYKTYKTWKIYGKEMALSFNTHIIS